MPFLEGMCTQECIPGVNEQLYTRFFLPYVVMHLYTCPSYALFTSWRVCVHGYNVYMYFPVCEGLVVMRASVQNESGNGERRRSEGKRTMKNGDSRKRGRDGGK